MHACMHATSLLQCIPLHTTFSTPCLNRRRLWLPAQRQGDERVKESVLSRAEQQAQHEPESAAGPTPQDMRHMMARAAATGGGGGGSGGDGRPQPPATPVPRSQFADHSEAGASPGVQQGVEAAEGWEQEEAGEALEAYGKKSLRKIVDEMKARGWRPMQVRRGRGD